MEVLFRERKSVCVRARFYKRKCAYTYFERVSIRQSVHIHIVRLY